MHSNRFAAIAVMMAALQTMVCAYQAAFAEDNPFAGIHVVTSRSR